MPMDLDSLVARSREGDMDAFGELVGRLHGEVRGWAAMMAVSPDWIDDVAQETFIEVHRALPRFDPSLSFPAWIRGILRNVVRRHGERRSKDARLRLDALARYLRDRESDQETADPRADEGSLDRLRRCLDRLPEHLRTLLMLRYAEDKSSSVIAELLKRSADGVRMALMRTRETLLQCMGAGGRP